MRRRCPQSFVPVIIAVGVRATIDNDAVILVAEFKTEQARVGIAI